MTAQEYKSISSKSTLTSSKIVKAIPTPTYSSGKWAVLTATSIAARPATVFELSVDSATWPSWNTFVPRTSPALRLEPGTKLNFHNKMKESGPTDSDTQHEVVQVENVNRDGRSGYIIVWKTVGIPLGDWLLYAERVQEIFESADGKSTEYKTWGTFGGPMASVLRWTGVTDQIVARFEDWANDLKEYAEKDETRNS